MTLLPRRVPTGECCIYPSEEFDECNETPRTCRASSQKLIKFQVIWKFLSCFSLNYAWKCCPAASTPMLAVGLAPCVGQVREFGLLDRIHKFPVPYPQCIIQNSHVHISVLNGALWDMGQVHCGIFKIEIMWSQCLTTFMTPPFSFVFSLTPIWWWIHVQLHHLSYH